MVLLKEKISTENIRQQPLRQGSKIRLFVFNYCFLIYQYLIYEIKKNAHFTKGILLDVGCGSSPFEIYFRKYVTKYLKHEHPDAIKENYLYDYISELPKINAPDCCFDTVLSMSVLEHILEPFETIKEMGRILKPNGNLMLYVPQYWHLHEEPFDYLRFTKYAIIEKLTSYNFEILYLKEIGKSFSVAGQSLCNALVLLFELEHVKNLIDFISFKKCTNLKKV